MKTDVISTTFVFEIAIVNSIVPVTVTVFAVDTGEFKKLQRQLQRKRHIKIELCVKLILLRLFRVDHVAQNRRTALSLAWHEWFS